MRDGEKSVKEEIGDYSRELFLDLPIDEEYEDRSTVVEIFDKIAGRAEIDAMKRQEYREMLQKYSARNPEFDGTYREFLGRFCEDYVREAADGAKREVGNITSLMDQFKGEEEIEDMIDEVIEEVEEEVGEISEDEGFSEEGLEEYGREINEEWDL